MALVTINDVTVVRGSITLPLHGVWSADLVIDQPDGSGFDAGTKVTIKAADGIELKGTVMPDRSGSFLDAVHVMVLGGAAGMGKDAKARSYVQPGAFVRDVLNGALGDVGESLSSTVAQDILQTNLAAWSTMAQPASHAINALLDWLFPAQGWRILADGTFWTGTESWPTSMATVDVIEQSPENGEFVLGIETLQLEAGQALDGVGKLERIEYEIESSKIRAHVMLFTSGEDRGARGAIATIARQEMAGIDFFALYDAKVISQSGDGKTVDLQPVDARLDGMQRVDLKLGLPGCVAKFAPGKMLRLGWDGGDPRKPYATIFDGGETVTALELAGNAYKALQTSTLLNDLSTLMGFLVTWVPLVVIAVAAAPSGTAVDPGVATQAAAIKTKIAANGYDSTVVSHG